MSDYLKQTLLGILSFLVVAGGSSSVNAQDDPVDQELEQLKRLEELDNSIPPELREDPTPEDPSNVRNQELKDYRRPYTRVPIERYQRKIREKKEAKETKLAVHLGWYTMKFDPDNEKSSGLILEPRFKLPLSTLFQDRMDFWWGGTLGNIVRNDSAESLLRLYFAPRYRINDTFRVLSKFGYARSSGLHVEGPFAAVGAELEVHELLWLEFGVDTKAYYFGVTIAIPNKIKDSYYKDLDPKKRIVQ